MTCDAPKLAPQLLSAVTDGKKCQQCQYCNDQCQYYNG